MTMLQLMNYVTALNHSSRDYSTNTDDNAAINELCDILEPLSSRDYLTNTDDNAAINELCASPLKKIICRHRGQRPECCESVFGVGSFLVDLKNVCINIYNYTVLICD
jgi:hypothetical protein